MSLNTKRIIIGALGGAFLISLILVQWMEVVKKREESGLAKATIVVPASSKECVECHEKANAGIVDHWKSSTHAEKGVGCIECHTADNADADSFTHYGAVIATVVTPRDCGRCHVEEEAEFSVSHHAKAGNILASLDNFLAETVEGARLPYAPHSPTPGIEAGTLVNGMASVNLGCKQCHGSKVALLGTDGSKITWTS